MEAINGRGTQDGQSTFTLDDFLQAHALFLNSCSTDLLLSEEPLILCVEKIVELSKETIMHVEKADGDIDIEFMEQEYAATVDDLLVHIKNLSNSRREKNWMDVAYSLGIVPV